MPGKADRSRKLLQSLNGTSPTIRLIAVVDIGPPIMLSPILFPRFFSSDVAVTKVVEEEYHIPERSPWINLRRSRSSNFETKDMRNAGMADPRADVAIKRFFPNFSIRKPVGICIEAYGSIYALINNPAWAWGML